MTNSSKRWSLLTLFAIIGTCVYCVFTWISASNYPGSFGPMTDYLSVLGNSSLNPEGAVFYNLGVALTGLSLIPFYIGIYLEFGAPTRSRLISIATLAGFLNGLSVILSAVFSEDMYELHFIWSLMIFLTWIPVLFLTNSFLFRMSESVKWIGAYGLALALFDTAFVTFVVLFGTSTGSIIEWLTIFCFMGWCVILAIFVLRKQR